MEYLVTFFISKTVDYVEQKRLSYFLYKYSSKHYLFQ
jgi:hypothetical protein